MRAIVEAEDWDGPSFQAVADAAMVCHKFETSRWREALSFKHHRKVAASRQTRPTRCSIGARSRSRRRASPERCSVSVELIERELSKESG
jgi:hypothetical protein